MNQYLFSQFNPAETNNLFSILQEIFHISNDELKTFYDSTRRDFDLPGWNHKKWLPRDAFTSSVPEFQIKYQQSPVIGIDLPCSFELKDSATSKATVVIIAQDSLRKVDNRVELIEVGTPFGLDNIECRTNLGTKIYMQMVDVLLQFGFRVYLTDLNKIWISDGTKQGISLPKADRERFARAILKELEIVQATAVIAWGRRAEYAVKNLNIRHLSFPHPSSANNGTWVQAMGKPATLLNKLEFFQSRIQQELAT